jgi:transcriptional regulator with XRE-family HTH domain
MALKKIQDKKKLPNKDLINLGKRIKEIRIKLGYSNYENFAFEHDIPRAQYGRYENGEDLRYTSLLRVIRAFDMTLEEFFKGMDK